MFLGLGGYQTKHKSNKRSKISHKYTRTLIYAKCTKSKHHPCRFLCTLYKIQKSAKKLEKNSCNPFEPVLFYTCRRAKNKKYIKEKETKKC